jgi:hypothetical protein
VIQLEEEGIDCLLNPPIPGHHLLQDVVLGVYGDLPYGGLFQVATQGVGVEDPLGDFPLPPIAVGIFGIAMNGHQILS